MSKTKQTTESHVLPNASAMGQGQTCGREEARLQALRRCAIIDTLPEEAFDRITALAARLFHVPYAFITFLDETRQWIKSCWGTELQEAPREGGFCTYAIEGESVMVVEDALHDPRFAESPFVTGAPGVRFYAGAPLRTSAGLALGTLCVMGTAGPREFFQDEHETLACLADMVMREVEMRSTALLAVQNAEALRETNLRLEALIQASPLAICTLDGKGIVQSWNAEAERLFGWSEAEAVGAFFPIVPPDRMGHFHETDKHLQRGETVSNMEVPCLTKGGGLRDVSISIGPLRNAAGEMTATITMMTDISHRKRTEEALARAEENYRSIFENAVEGIFQTAKDGHYVSANPSLARILGYDSPAELRARVTSISTHLYADEARRAEFIRLMDEQGAVSDFVSQVYRKNGTLVWVSENARVVRGADGEFLYYEGTVEDITERMTLEAEREGQLAEALERADHDPLTGLLNHRAFHRALEQEADRAQREGTSLAMAVLDLDNFKFFNDAYGHAVGDDVLRQVAGALSSVCRSYDTLARFGGDEFAILMPNMTSGQAAEFTERLNERTQAIGFRAPGSTATIPLGLSMGMAIFPDDGPGRLEALACADARLLRAKSGAQDEKTEHLRATLTRSVDGFSMLDALVTAVDNKDRYTRRHSEDVMRYSAAIARELGLDDATQHNIEVAGLLHDVGKIGVPDAILRKPGRLTDEEYAAIKHHPLMGSIIVGSVPGFEEVLEAIRHHHERWDGGGYPFGLRGEAIPLAARIMAVGDAYSAMTTDRPYRKGMQSERAFAILEDGSGQQWDPGCVAAFIKTQREFLEAISVCKAAERALREACLCAQEFNTDALPRETVLSQSALGQARCEA